MEYLNFIFLFTIIFILIIIVYNIEPSEDYKIKRFKCTIKRKYKEKNIEFFCKIKLAGDYYYIFKTIKKTYTVSENGYITIK